MQLEQESGLKIPQREYEDFLINSKLNEDPNININPTVFSNHIAQLERLSMRLNYRFLELDSKLRFLRLISSGNGMDFDELNEQSKLEIELNDKVQHLESKLNDIKRETRSLRKKIGRCVYQNEVRRCVEGKDKLELELEDLKGEIKELKTWFIENDIIQQDDDDDDDDQDDVEVGGDGNNNNWIEQIPSANTTTKMFQDPEFGLNNIKTIQTQLIKEKERIEQDTFTLDGSISTLKEEIQQLQSMKSDIEDKINDINTRRLSLDTKELEKLNQITHLKTLIGLWSEF